MQNTDSLKFQPWVPQAICCFACAWLGSGALASALAQDAAPQAEANSLNKLPSYPLDVVVDGEGSAFVVDRNLPGVWQWQADKLAVFFQGSKTFRTPLNAARCLAWDKDGTLLVGDTSTRDIYRVTAGGKAEPLTGGQIGIPMDLAVKSDGTIYVADLELRMLLRIPAGTQSVERVAAVNPRGVFVDSKDQVWVISQDPEQLQIVSDDGSTQIIVDHRVFNLPQQVVVDASGVAFVSDNYEKAIWKVAPGEEPKILFQGAPLVSPVGLYLADDKLLIVDPHARQVFRMGSDNQVEAWFEVKQ